MSLFFRTRESKTQQTQTPTGHISAEDRELAREKTHGPLIAGCNYTYGDREIGRACRYPTVPRNCNNNKRGEDEGIVIRRHRGIGQCRRGRDGWMIQSLTY